MYVVDSLRYMYSIPRSSGIIDIGDIIKDIKPLYQRQSLWSHFVTRPLGGSELTAEVRSVGLQPWDQTAVAVILRVSFMEPYIKLAIRFHFGWLTIASQPVVIDHRANPPTIV
jgi:hypothetical protein